MVMPSLVGTIGTKPSSILAEVSLSEARFQEVKDYATFLFFNYYTTHLYIQQKKCHMLILKYQFQIDNTKSNK